MKKKMNTPQANQIRTKAEEVLKNREIKHNKHYSEFDAQRFIHELEVHQIELEMQNEELLNANIIAEQVSEKYRELYDFAPSGYFTFNKKGEIIELNLAGSKMLGKNRSELKKRLFGFFVSYSSKPIFNSFLINVFNSSISESCEISLQIIGNIFHVHLAGSYAENSETCLVSAIDLTEQKETAHQLVASEQKYMRLFNSMTEMFQVIELIYDEYGKVCDYYYRKVNPAFEKWVGKTADQLIGKTAKELFSSVDDYWLKTYKRVAATGKAENFENFGAERDKYYNLNVWKVDEKLVAIIFTDITDKKRVDAELKKIEWLLQPKREKFKKTIQEYGDLTILNHDRTILDSVGKEVLLGIVSDYLALLDTSAAVYEKNGDYALGIFSSKWCQYLDSSSRALCKCNTNKQALESGKWLCHESCWADASLLSIKTDKSVDIECSGGLHIYAIPIKAYNKIIGSINFGYGNPPTDTNKLIEIASTYEVSIDKLKSLAETYETRPKFIIDIAKEKLDVSARLIGEIVERKMAEQALKASDTRFDLAMNAAQEGLFDWNLITNEIYFSPNWKKMLGYKDSELPNDIAIWEKLTSNEGINKLRKLQNDVINKTLDRFELEFKMKHKDGHWLDVLSRAKVIFDTHGRAVKMIGTHIDISENKIVGEELLKAKEKAEESDRLKTAFLTNMSHEIRTPLNAVLGFSQLLTDANLTGKEKSKFAEYIRLNGESLAKIIDDIIDISKLQSKQLKIHKTDFNLHTLLNELNIYYGNLLIQKLKGHIKLELEMPGSLEDSFFINTDEQRLKQILNNLISNAVKYSDKGCITFGYKVLENKLYFFVKDTGFGITKENLSQIFERFVQFSQQYVSKQEGTGLGLSISKNLVAMLGGELMVESTWQKGSVFYFEIPLVKANKKEFAISNSTIKLDRDLSNYKILIADDEDSNCVLTKRLLKHTKVKSDWATNGKHAVEMAIAVNYDLILMDIKMPEMDGIEATRKIKKYNKNIPIIMQTAFAMSEVRKEAMEAGCDGFIVKPISIEVFLELVNKHIK